MLSPLLHGLAKLVDARVPFDVSGEFSRNVLHNGFMEHPSIMKGLELAREPAEYQDSTPDS